MTTIPTQGSIFFDSLSQNEIEVFSYLENTIQNPEVWCETEWIDFKNGRDGNAKEHWSKALSGFGNSGGGVLIWGIQTKRKDDHDVPANLALVQNPRKLEGQLKEWLKSTVEPPVLGVKTRSITNAENEGFVVAYVPSSDLKPHCALDDKRWYFLRAGHQFVPANTALLRMLFYPKSIPILILKQQNIRLIEDGFSALLGLYNIGFISATDLTLIIEDKTEKLQFTLQSPWHRDSSHDAKYQAVLSNDSPLHPKVVVPFAQYSFFAESCPTIMAIGKDLQPFKWQIKPNHGNNTLDIVPMEFPLGF